MVLPISLSLMSLDVEPGQGSQLVRRKMLRKMERIHVLNDGPGGEFINSGTTLTTEFAICKKIHFLCHLSHSEFICMVLAAKVTYCLCLSPHKMPSCCGRAVGLLGARASFSALLTPHWSMRGFSSKEKGQPSFQGVRGLPPWSNH